ncbi:PEP-CTERM sorting domain-containing protein [Pseudaquabacterium pictum]
MSATVIRDGDVLAVPEPSTAAFLAAGVAVLLAGAAYRRGLTGTPAGALP